MQLIQFVLMIFIFLGFTSALLYAIPNITGISAGDIASVSENSPRSHISAALWVQALSSLFVFTLPVLLFAYSTHPRPKQYLGLRSPGKAIHWPLVILIMLSLLPVLIYIAGLLGQIDFGEKAKELQEQNDRMMKAFLSIKNLTQLLVSFIVLAIIPAVGEELLFRSVLMRFAAKRSRTMVFPIVVSALMFALMHTNPQGMFSIFAAGVVLALIYYLTGSLWCSILAHLFHNGLQVVLMYISLSNGMLKNIVQEDNIPIQYALIGLVVFVASLYLLWKNRTPLPATWSNDFNADELEELQRENNNIS
jgi:membrane protease YdiL (CAAX protease family)